MTVLRQENMPDVETNLQAAAAQIDANPFAFLQHLGQIPQVVLHQQQHLMWVSTAAPVGLFNSVFNIQAPAAREIKAAIAETVGWFRDRGRSCAWWVGPSARPADLTEHLAAAGGRLVDTIALMASPLASLPLAEADASVMTLAPVYDRPSLRAFADIYCRARGYDETASADWYDLLGGLALAANEPLQHYLGYVHGQAAVCASLFLGAGVAGLYHVSTLPEFRRQGLGRRITLQALAEAQKRGYHIAMLGSEPAAQKLYLRLGFVQYAPMQVFAWAGRPG